MNSNKDKVAILKFSGPIFDNGAGFISFNNMRQDIDKAFHMENVKSVMIMMNSAGGSPAQSALLSSYITKLSNSTKIPVYVFIEDQALSTGYNLALSGNKMIKISAGGMTMIAI